MQQHGDAAGAVAALQDRGRREGRWLVVGEADLQAVAGEWGIPVGELIRLGLAAGVVPARFLRNMGVLGVEGQLRLLDAQATVIGLGGAGGLVAETLARAGVGTLVLVDRDVLEESNLNRQLLAISSTIGRSKAEVAGERIREVNPHTQVVVRRQALTAETVRGLLEEPSGATRRHRVVVDCLDSGRDRLILQRGCRELGLPLVHGAVSGWRGRVTLIMPDGPGLEHFYDDGDVPTAEEIVATGVAPPVPAIMGAWEAGVALRVLLGDTSKSGLVFTYDVSSGHGVTVPFGLARMSAAWWRRRKRPAGRTGEQPAARR
ncbi:MAG: ThiF family adenylyltransferase [Bacillota bacterium]